MAPGKSGIHLPVGCTSLGMSALGWGLSCCDVLLTSQIGGSFKNLLREQSQEKLIHFSYGTYNQTWHLINLRIY